MEVSLSLERSSNESLSLNRELVTGYIGAFRAAAAEFSLAAVPDLNAILRIPGALEAANESGALHVPDPPTLARLLFGALTRAGLLIASSPEPTATRDAVAATLRALITGFAPRPGDQASGSG